ncbi:STING domain-containing protein [Hwangdonia sp.]|uniref:CBASS system CD-NTase-associated NAD(+) hydrolase Cap12 n=1 Tax=Hwangdonia sp. TaxID=1883432 RepID=UPI003AB8333E
MHRKKIFIGSSSEELTLANRAKDILEKDFDVTIWNDNVWDTAVFRINHNFLADLLKASLRFDFGILIGSQDDKVEIRGQEVMKPRDNVLFELGLFTGRLGTSKCAFIIDKEIDLLSDFKGISLARYDNSDLNSFDEAVLQCGEMFSDSREDEINFFPSATLASVYFENFVKPVCTYIINNGLVSESIHYDKCNINIIVPNKINEDVNLQFQQIKKRMNTKDVSIDYAGRARNFTVEAKAENGILEIIDFPTIIKGINHSISNLLPGEFNKYSDGYDSILDRELRRFITTLKKLVLKNGFDEIINVKRESEVKLTL